MSWSVYLTEESGTCSQCGQETSGGVVESIGDMTYNVAPMYYRALEFAWKQINGKDYVPQGGDSGFGLRQLSGVQCANALGYLFVACAHMKNNPDEYKKMNPPNGWGSYETALEFLEKLRNEALNHLGALIEVH